MKPLLAAAVVMVSAVCVRAAEAPALAAWVDVAVRYCGQAAMSVDYGYAPDEPVAGAEKISFRDVLRRLPEPSVWPELVTAVDARLKALPADKRGERQRLEAVRWLVIYLAQGKGAALEALPAKVEASDEQTYEPGAFELERLRDALNPEAEGADGGRSFAGQLKVFEDSLDMLTEVTEEQLIEIAGGAEKFVALKRMIEGQKELRARTRAIGAELKKKSIDPKAAVAELDKANAEFRARNAADFPTLTTLMSNAAVRNYYMQQFQEEDAVQRERAPMDVEVPDKLVAQLGAERAEALLKRALALPARLQVDEKDVETMRLARRIALEQIETMRAAQWALTVGERDGALFEALKRWFPKQAVLSEHAYKEAHAWRIVGLVFQGEIARALAMSEEMEAAGDFSLPYGTSAGLSAQEESRFVDYFFGRVRKNPSENEWSTLVQITSKTGRTGELTALVDELAADAQVKGLSRLVVQRMKAESELAQEKIEAGVARLLALIAEPQDDQQALSRQSVIAGRLLVLAELRGGMDMDAVVAAGDALSKKAWMGMPAEALDVTVDWMRALNKAGRHAEAARAGEVAISEIAADDAKKRGAGNSWESGLSQSYRTGGLLAEQLCALVELGRWDDAAKLIQENAWWQTRDVAGLLYTTVESTKRPLGFYAGKIALAQGDRARARSVLEAQVLAAPASDAVYAAWLELAGTEALPLLEKLAAADRYEERPLIWKAHLLIEARRWDEAEAVLRAAITIDPSDGEQGRGDRMRVYAFMAQVMAGKGDTKQAAFFDDVVKAIRLSERADRWFEAGAYSRAIVLYRESLGFFADAYCIQSRLAVRLSKEGKMDEAAVHYQKAFELMPDSFGRVESHCFGCEKVFEGEKTQSVAEGVFTRMLAARPENPQLHYLMGYLNEERGRIAEAAGFYRAAVKLDPLYLNAWKKLSQLDERSGLTAAERDDLELTIFALDPGRRHGSPDLEKVADLARLWRVIAAAETQLKALRPPEALWAMPASAAAMSAAGAEQNAWRGSRAEVLDFPGVLVQTSFAQAWQSYVVVLPKASR